MSGRGEGASPLTIVATPEDAGDRLDAFLARVLSHHSRARWRSLIDDGHVMVDGARARPSQKVGPGARVVVEEPPPAPTSTLPEDIPLTVLFEDAHVIVVDKPAGMVVHPAAGVQSGTLVNALLHHVTDLDVGGEERPGIVHRLDKDTSGVLVCAKTEEALRSLQRAFQERTVEKRYRAWCYGAPRAQTLELVTGHARHPRDRKRFTTKLPPPDEGDATGVRRASARYTFVTTFAGVSEVEVALDTGRTHQIRAQLADIGHPIAGDALYGGSRRTVDDGALRALVDALPRQALHAERLVFPHPISGERVAFSSPLPPDLAALYACLRRTRDQAGC